MSIKVPRSYRGITTPQAGEIGGRSAGVKVADPQLGAAVAQFGDQIATVATSIENDRLSRQMARRQLDVARDLNAARLEFDQMDNPDQIEAGWSPRISEIRQKYLTGQDDAGHPLVDPKNAERFGLVFDGLADQHAVSVARRGISLRGATRTAARREMASEAVSQSGSAPEGVRDNLVAMALGRIVEDLDANLITTPEAEAERQLLTDNVAVESARSIKPIIEDIKKNTAGRPQNLMDQSIHGAEVVLSQRNLKRRSDQDKARREVAQMPVNVLQPEIPPAPPVPEYDPATARAATVKQQASVIAAELDGLPIPQRLDAVEKRLENTKSDPDTALIQSGMDGLQRITALANNGALLDDPEWSPPVPPAGAPQSKKHSKWLSEVGRVHGRSANIQDDAGLDQIQSDAEALLEQGVVISQDTGAPRASEAEALQMVRDGYQQVLEKPDVDVMRQSGATLPDVPDDIRQMPAAIVDRAGAADTLRADLGLQNGDDFDPSEVTQISTAYAQSPAAEKVRFLSGLADLDMLARLRLAKSVASTDGNLADAILAANADPQAASGIDGSGGRELSKDDIARARALGGDDAVTYATALSRANVDDPAGTAVGELAMPKIREAMDVVTYLSRDEAAAELQDMALSPDQIEYLLPHEPAPFEAIEDPDLADEAQAMIVDDPDVALLSEAMAYVPDSPQAVEEFQANAAKLKAMDPPARAEFIATQTADRQARDRANITKPLYYGDGEVTAEGLKQAARRLVLARRALRLDDATYRAQAVLIHKLAQTFPADQIAYEQTAPSSAPDQGQVVAADIGDETSIAAAIIQNRRNSEQSAGVDFLEGFSGVGQDELPVVNPSPNLKAVAADIGRGITEAPKQILGGVRDAAFAGMTGIAAFDEWASDALGFPKLQITNPDTGEIDLRILSASEADQAKVSLPEVDAAKTVTGGLVRGVSQFLTGFVGGQKALGLMGKTTTALGAGGRAAGASAISDFAAFDAHEARLSDFIQQYPSFANPITEYLASDQDDSELEGRLKNVAEGALSDIGITALVAGIRSIRKARRAKAKIGGETYAEAQSRLARDPRSITDPVPDMSAIFKSDAPLVAAKGDPDLDAATRAYLDRVGGKVSDVAGGIPAEDAALALTHGKVETAAGDVFINWSRIDGPQDVKAVIQQMADAAKGEIGAAGRGTRSNAKTALSADQENAWSLLAERRTGDALNAEQTLAMRRLWASSGERLLAAAKLVQEAPSDANTFAFRRAVALHGTIQKEVLAVRTETARALQQWSIPAGTDELMAKQISETVNMFGGADVADDLATRIIGLAEDGNLAAVDQLTRKSAGAATFDAVSEYWINAILSGPKTHMVNAISNTGVIALAQMERLTAAGIGAVRGGTDRVAAGEAGAMLHGAIASLPEAFRYMREAFKTGASGFGMQKIEAPRTRSISTEALGGTTNASFNELMNTPLVSHGINAMGAVVTIPGRMLGASDEFFKTINYRMELHAQAARKVSAELRDGTLQQSGAKDRMAQLLGDVSDDAAMQAREFAQYNTFTNEPGKFANAISSLKKKAPILRFVVPFVNTPANILRFAAERTPAAPLLSGFRADIRAGGARADMALAKMGLGTTAMLATFDYAMNGHITGSGPSNPSERAALRRTGWQPYSIKFGDRYYAYNRLDPLGKQLGIAAELAEVALNSAEDPGAQYDEMAYRAIASVGENMLDSSYLRGVSDLVTAMSDPQRFAPSYFEKFASSFVPKIVGEVASAKDPQLHRITNTVDAIKSRVPGLSGDVPVRHDLWGRPIGFQSGLGDGYDAVSPIYSSMENPEPIDQEFSRIDYFPGQPSTKITIDRTGYSLRNSPEIYEGYVVLQGATSAKDLPRFTKSNGQPTASSLRMDSYGNLDLRQLLNAVVTGEHDLAADYIDADQAGKQDMIKRVISDYRRAARQALINQNQDFFNQGGNQ